MNKFSILLTLFILFSLTSHSQDTTYLGQKAQYKGLMKNVQFEYFENWALDDGQTGLTLTPDKFKNNIEIHREKLTIPVTQRIMQIKKELKETGESIEEVKFNGMKAYKFGSENKYGYFIFINNIQYDFLVDINERYHEAKINDTYRKQVELMVKSFTIK